MRFLIHSTKPATVSLPSVDQFPTHEIRDAIHKSIGRFRRGMYEAVTLDPDTPPAVAPVAETASSYGFHGVVLRNADAIDESVETSAVDVVRGTTVRTETTQRASGAVGNVRPDYTLVLVEGGTPAMNRF